MCRVIFSSFFISIFIFVSNALSEQIVASSLNLSGGTDLFLYDTDTSNLNQIGTIDGYRGSGALYYDPATQNIVGYAWNASNQQRLIVFNVSTGQIVSADPAPVASGQVLPVELVGSATSQSTGPSVSQLATSVGSNSAAISKNSARIDTNAQGVAMAFALGGGGALSADENGALSADVGYFEGFSAIALNGVARIDKNISISGGMAIGLEKQIVGGRAGLRFSW